MGGEEEEGRKVELNHPQEGGKAKYQGCLVFFASSLLYVEGALLCFQFIFNREGDCACALCLIFCNGFLKFGYVRTRNVILYCFLQGKAGGNKTTGSGRHRFVKGFRSKMMKTRLRPR